MMLLVTGGRDFDAYSVGDALTRFSHECWPFNTLIVGDCPSGVDAEARHWVRRHPAARGVTLIVGQADWKLGKKAGPLRNQWMVDQGPGHGLVFPGGVGTADCLKRLLAANIPVTHADTLMLQGSK